MTSAIRKCSTMECTYTFLSNKKSNKKSSGFTNLFLNAFLPYMFKCINLMKHHQFDHLLWQLTIFLVYYLCCFLHVFNHYGVHLLQFFQKSAVYVVCSPKWYVHILNIIKTHTNLENPKYMFECSKCAFFSVISNHFDQGICCCVLKSTF